MYKIEVIIRVVNQHGDVVCPKGIPAMHPVDHIIKHTYPEGFADAAEAHKEMAQATGVLQQMPATQDLPVYHTRSRYLRRERHPA